MKNKLIKYPLILGTVALVAGLLLSLVYNVTKPVIDKNNEEKAAVYEVIDEVIYNGGVTYEK